MNKRLLSMFLALCMIVTMLPVSAMAEEIHTTIVGSGEITNFAPLTETEKTRALGTSIQDLELPETLTATVRTAVPADENPVQDSGNPGTATPATTTEPQWEETTVEIPVTWVSPGYDRNTECEYFFTPVVESYTVSAPLPEIVVTVGEMPPIAARGLVTPMFTTTYDIWVGGVQVTSENKEDVLGEILENTRMLNSRIRRLEHETERFRSREMEMPLSMLQEEALNMAASGVPFEVIMDRFGGRLPKGMLKEILSIRERSKSVE